MSSQHKTDRTLRIVLVVVAVLLLAPMLMMVFAVPLMGMWGGGMMGGYGMYGGPYGGSGLWGVGMSLVWLVVLVGGGYLLYRWLSGGGAVGADPAIEELRLAYARGDISEEEFEARRSKLGGE